MRILAIISGEYGRRHIENIREHGPSEWHIEEWKASPAFPPVIDDPQDHLPDSFPAADLVLSFAEHRGVAELLPDIVRMTGAQALIAAIDDEAWLPRGLARQLRGWLEEMNVVCVTPKPLCTLTEQDYGEGRRSRVLYEHKLISAFAHHFGQPELKLTIDPATHRITAAEVQRDAVCGCARYTAKNLIGVSADEAEEKAGLLHHHYPCMAAMGINDDYGDTLMHISGNVLKENVGMQVKPFKQVQVFRPDGRSE